METIKKVICIEEGLLSFHKGETCYVISEDNSYYKLKGTDGLFSKCFFEDIVNPKFKVGDFIKGTIGNDYLVTNQEMTKGVVTRFIKLEDAYLKDLDIEVEVVEHPNKYYIGHKYKVNSKYFEAYVAPESKFNIGDIVEPEDIPSGMVKGKVVDIFNQFGSLHHLTVLILDHRDKKRIGEQLRITPKGFRLCEQQTVVDVPKYPKVEFLGDGSKVVWNPPYTIIELGGNKGKSKCNPIDTYSELEGLKWALRDLVKK